MEFSLYIQLLDYFARKSDCTRLLHYIYTVFPWCFCIYGFILGCLASINLMSLSYCNTMHGTHIKLIAALILFSFSFMFLYRYICFVCLALPQTDACTNVHIDDEQMMFETCTRHEELNWNINLIHYVHVFCWFILHKGPPSFLYNGYGVFPGGKAARAWCWPPTPIFRAEVLKRTELYLYLP